MASTFLTLGTLAQLKAQLLNLSLQGDTDFDAALASLGLGVAGRFEAYCNRKFFWTVGDVFVTNADRTRLVLPRFPITAITAIAVRDDLTTGFIDQGPPDNVIFNLAEEIGEVVFAGYLGGSFSRLQLIFNGGFWFDASDNGSGIPTHGQHAPSPRAAARLAAAMRMGVDQSRPPWRQPDRRRREQEDFRAGPGRPCPRSAKHPQTIR